MIVILALREHRDFAKLSVWCRSNSAAERMSLIKNLDAEKTGQFYSMQSKNRDMLKCSRTDVTLMKCQTAYCRLFLKRK